MSYGIWDLLQDRKINNIQDELSYQKYTMKTKASDKA